MSDQLSFIEQVEVIVLKNLNKDQFGVSELAEAMHMSRSNLLRRIKKQTQLSASQFIRQVRLREAMSLLQQNSHTVSEVSDLVGFGSTSYFIKCFREQYGFSPGEISKGEGPVENTIESTGFLSKYRWYIGGATAVLIAFAAVLLLSRTDAVNSPGVEKSIAVLPFKNQSADSTNIYFVNGLMESSLYNLQKIEDLRVISRTSVEKYRHSNKSIPEIAEELDVNYIVEGSGQRLGNKVLLNIQLIDVQSDQPIWVGQYNRETVDIFSLQNDIANQISSAIKAIVTPKELAQIEKKPTDNLEAYDHYLQAMDPYLSRTEEGLNKAIPLFEKAVLLDPEFALAYAHLAISYYHLDRFKNDKQYTELINNYADKALLYDSKNDISLIAKALYYMYVEEYQLAVPHLEKALEYNPNSAAVVQVLSRLYSTYLPDTAKYLKNALRGMQLEVTVSDSIAQAYIYLDLSNAFSQCGFTDLAMTYIDKTLEYDPNNYYAPHLKAFVEYAQNKNFAQLIANLETEYEKDSTRLDILKDIAKLHYYNEDYEQALGYYQGFVKAKKQYNLNIYPEEDINIAQLHKTLGNKEKASVFFQQYVEFCKKNQSVYSSVGKAAKHAYEGKIELGIQELKNFAQQDHYQYWLILFIEKDPVFKKMSLHPDYEDTIQQIKARFWQNHERLKKDLKKNELI
ncbi:helix-turn-helix domain-containing protein [Nonlabens xiamenensis]|uniref:helix-turn-helix domain-containing protein n=1 Tax=Nonlabens xiamenensis TaxID=2341043 RepID=UPI000F61403B|nr:helix-turn-helix domain-containing protein [Nonlabens xiamenensis]